MIIQKSGDPERESASGYESEHEPYRFTRMLDERNSLVPKTKEVLGGKGLGLVELTELGLPVPPGIIVTTGGWCEFRAASDTIPNNLWKEITIRLRELEKQTGKRLNDPNNPLLVSVRSGAPVSMPGAMHTILNIGLNDQTISALSNEIGEHSAWEAYLDLIAEFGEHVYGVDISSLEIIKQQNLAVFRVQQINELPLVRIQRLVQTAKQLILQSGFTLPDDPTTQIQESMAAVFRSWENPIAQKYREQFHISDTLGTATTIQKMIWGNSLKKGAGSGVYFTHDPHSLGPSIIDFAPHAQGTQVVGDEAQLTNTTDQLPSAQVSLLETIGVKLETHFSRPQEIEFTFDGHALWLLQTRDVPLSHVAWFRYLLHSVHDAQLDINEAQRLIPPVQLRSLLAPGLDPQAVEHAIRRGNLLTSGIPISPGIVSAPWVNSIRAAKEADVPVILNSYVSMDDLVGLPARVAAIIAENGSIGSHIARIATKIGTTKGIPIVFGATIYNVSPDSKLTIDGNNGNVFLGTIPLLIYEHNGLLTETERSTALSWLGERMQNPWRFAGNSSEVQRYVVDVKQTLEKTEYADIRSLKAREIMVFNAAIPKEIRQTYTTITLDTPEALVRTIQPILTRIFASGNHSTIRTCHDPALPAGGPWALVRNMDDFRRFLIDDQYSKYGGLQQFLSHPQLTELLVGDIPIGKWKMTLLLNTNTRRGHFLTRKTEMLSSRFIRTIPILGNMRMQNGMILLPL